MAEGEVLKVTNWHFGVFVIQSGAKDLGNINVDAFEILRRYAPLNDKNRMSFQKKSLSSQP